MSPLILPGATIGILGGGQLGRMTAMEAKKMGYRVICLDPSPNSPCGQVCDDQIHGALNDLAAATELACQSDVVVYEFENINAEVVRALEAKFYVPQGSRLLAITQDRIQEKAHLANGGFPVVPYRVIENKIQLSDALQELGYPAVLKSASGGYDGKGQAVLRNESDLPVAEMLLREGQLYVLEKFIELLGEVSVIVARRADGETVVFPVAENTHRDNILHTTVVPARVTQAINDAAIDLASGIAQHLKLVGILAVEMFVTGDGLIVNELAPRPHNSGHYTFGACYTSQFEQFVRAVCNLPLGPTTLLHQAVMVNVLGCHIPNLIKHMHNLPGNVKVHLYGKEGGALEPKRKMGHLLIESSDSKSAIEWAEKLLTCPHPLPNCTV